MMMGHVNTQPTATESGVTTRVWDIDFGESKDLRDYIMEEVEEGVFRFHLRPLVLLSVLSEFRNLDATDPRDKIFAFLNLATDSHGILPDYHATAQDVFRAATEKIMKGTGLLSVLSHVQVPGGAKLDGLPGWVPDFSVRLGRVPFDKGGAECMFNATGLPVGDTLLRFHPDGTLGVEGMRVDTVSAVTDMDVDAPIQILKLALRVPSRYPGMPLAWWSVKVKGGGRRMLRSREISRVEALWRTLIADNLTETEEEYGDLRTKTALAAGFSNWILRDILESRSLVDEYIQLDPDNWVGKLIFGSFCTRLFLWSAMYDGRQVFDFDDDDVPNLEDAINDLRYKETNEENQYLLDLHLGVKDPTIGVLHLPTANKLLGCFQKPVTELDLKDVKDHLTGKYRASALARLSPRDRTQIQDFEKHMRAATEGRSLFCTRGGRLGLGPKSTGHDPNCKDEVWILNGARVPFILRREHDNRYRIVGEAYCHGIMYGEAITERPESICLL